MAELGTPQEPAAGPRPAQHGPEISVSMIGAPRGHGQQVCGSERRRAAAAGCVPMPGGTCVLLQLSCNPHAPLVTATICRAARARRMRSGKSWQRCVKGRNACPPSCVALPPSTPPLSRRCSCNVLPTHPFLPKQACLQAREAADQQDAWLDRVEAAPIYRPTAEQWADPLAYIRGIQGEAARCGVCIVRAPVAPSVPGGLVGAAGGVLGRRAAPCFTFC